MKQKFCSVIIFLTQLIFSQHSIHNNPIKIYSSSNVSKQDIAKKIQLGDLYESHGFYSDALKCYNQILDFYKNKTKDTVYVDTNNKIGSIYKNTKQYKSAIGFLKEAVNVSKPLNYNIGLAQSLSILGANYEKQGDYIKALEMENKSLHYLNPSKDKFHIANVYENIGSIHEDLLNFDKAFFFFQKAYMIFRNTKTKEEANILNNIADIHRKKEDLEKATQITLQSLELSKKLKDNHLLESANKDLAKVYALKGDYKTAYKYRIESEKYKELASINQNKNLVNLLLSDFEIDRKEAEIKILEEQNKTNKMQLLLLIIIATSIITLLLLSYFFFRKKKIANEKIQLYKHEKLQVELQNKWLEEKNLQKSLALKTATLSNYSLHIAKKNKILSEISLKLKHITQRKSINHETLIKELYSEIDFVLQQENEWNDFTIFFDEIHPNYIKNLSNIAIEELSPAELKLGILLRLNLTSKEIASILRVTPDSVRVARHRFRKKLPIDSKQELINFLLELE